MKEQKIIAHNLRASFDQIADDLNGVMSALQKKMMRELLEHIDELNEHIKNLDDDIDHHMNADEKKAVEAITENRRDCGCKCKSHYCGHWNGYEPFPNRCTYLVPGRIMSGK